MIYMQWDFKTEQCHPYVLWWFPLSRCSMMVDPSGCSPSRSVCHSLTLRRWPVRSRRTLSCQINHWNSFLVLTALTTRKVSSRCSQNTLGNICFKQYTLNLKGCDFLITRNIEYVRTVPSPPTVHSPSLSPQLFTYIFIPVPSINVIPFWICRYCPSSNRIWKTTGELPRTPGEDPPPADCCSVANRRGGISGPQGWNWPWSRSNQRSLLDLLLVTNTLHLQVLQQTGLVF